MANANIVLSATDLVTGKLVDITAAFRAMHQEAQSGAYASTQAFATMQGALGALGIGVGAGQVIEFLSGMKAAVIEAEHSSTQLAFSLRNAVGDRGFEAYAAAAQLATEATAKYAVVSESTAQKALQLLITNTGDAAGSMEHLNLVFDLMQQKGFGLEASIKIISLAMEGNTMALKRQFPEFRNLSDEMDKHASNADKATFAIGYLTDKLGGARAEMGKTETATAMLSKAFEELNVFGGKVMTDSFNKAQPLPHDPARDSGNIDSPMFRMIAAQAASTEETTQQAEAYAKINAESKMRVEQQMVELDNYEEVAHWLGASVDSLRMMTDVERANWVIRQSQADASEKTAEDEQVRLIEQKNFMASLMEEKDRQDHITNSLAVQTKATQGLAAAVSVLRTAQEGLNTVNDRAFDAKLAKQGTVDDKLRLLRGAVGDTTDPKELEKLLSKTNALHSEAVQQGQTSAEADAKLLDLEKQRETVAAQSIMGSQAQLESRRASLDAVDQQITKQKEFINSLAASGGQSTDDVDRMAKDINTKLKDAYQTTLDGAKDDFLNLSKAMNDGKVPADEYATLLRDGFNSASEQARKLRADVESVNAALSSLNNNNLEAFALAKQTVANNNQVLLAAALAKKTSDPTSGAGLTDAERAQAEVDYQNRLSSDLNSSHGTDMGGGGGTSSVQPSIDFSSVIPAFARGGIVRRPTLALVGEAGPEAIVPLNGRTGGAAGITVHLTVNGGFSTADEIQRTVRDVLVPQLKEAMR